MLEQELQEQENIQPQVSHAASPEPELFEQYEIKNWSFSPRLYKILAASTILNLFALVVFAQTNLLTRKGCESPLVGRVCDVIDAVYVGKVLLGTDTEYVSKAYEKTELEDVDITYVDVSGQAPPLNYPAGYFALANPESVMPDVIDTTTPDGWQMPPAGAMSIPGIPNNNPIANGTDLSKIPQTLPPPIKNPISGGKLPTSPLGNGNNPIGPNVKIRTPKNRFPKIPQGSPNELPNLGETADKDGKKPDDKQNPGQKDIKSEKVENDGKFNKQPLEDFGKNYGKKILDKEVDVNAPFTIEVTAKLDDKGKFVNPKVSAKEGSDPKMTEVAKAAIAAFSDTNLLKPLYELGARDVVITFSQDKDNLQAIIKSKTKTPNAAKSLQSNLNLIIQGATAFMNKDSDEAKLMSQAQLGTDKEFLIINFLISNEEKTKLIEKNLKSLEKKLQENQNNGLATTKNTNTAK